MPTDHGRGLYDGEGLPPARPALRENRPEGSVPRPEAKAPATAGPDQHRDLLTQRQILERELAPRPEQRSHRPEDGPDESPHASDRTR